jgi:hypothetical protein
MTVSRDYSNKRLITTTSSGDTVVGANVLAMEITNNSEESSAGRISVPHVAPDVVRSEGPTNNNLSHWRTFKFRLQQTPLTSMNSRELPRAS